MYNALRVILICLLSLFLICASLIFVLFSLCGVFSSQNAGDRSFAIALLIGYGVILVGSIFAIARLVKGMRHEKAIALQIQAPQPTELPLTPADHQIIEFLRYALMTEIAVSVLSWTLNLIHTPARGTWPAILVSFVIYQIPYAVLLWKLTGNLDRPTQAFSLAVPGAAMLWGCYRMITLWTFIRGQQQYLLTTAIFLIVDLGIFLLALRLQRQRRVQGLTEWLILAGCLSFLYFGLAQSGMFMLYRFFHMQ